MKEWGLQEHWGSQLLLSKSVLQGEEDAKKAWESVFAGLLVAGLNWTGLSQCKRRELSVSTGSLCSTHGRDEGSQNEIELKQNHLVRVRCGSFSRFMPFLQSTVHCNKMASKLAAGTCCSMQQWRENAREVGQGAGTWKRKQCQHGALLPMQGWHRL